VKAKIDNVKAKIQDKEEKRPWPRPTLARRPVFGQLAASPTSSPLEGSPRQLSTSHDKPGPDWHVGLDARRENRHQRAWRNDTPRHACTTVGGHAGSPPRQEPSCWSDGLRGHHIAIISHSATRKRGRRHSSTLYDAHKPRLRLGRGGLGEVLGQTETNADYSEKKPSVTERTVKPGHAAAPTTKYHDSASMCPDGQ
jgi:hypothetical protein